MRVSKINSLNKETCYGSYILYSHPGWYHIQYILFPVLRAYQFHVFHSHCDKFGRRRPSYSMETGKNKQVNTLRKKLE